MMIRMTHGGWDVDDAEIIAIDEHSALCLAAHEAGSPLWQSLVDGTSQLATTSITIPSKPSGLSFWGAGSTTSAPLVSTPQ